MMTMLNGLREMESVRCETGAGRREMVLHIDFFFPLSSRFTPHDFLNSCMAEGGSR